MGRYTCLKCMFEAKLGEMKQHCAVKHGIGKTCLKCSAISCSPNEHQEHWTLSGHPKDKSSGMFPILGVDYILNNSISSGEGTPSHSEDDSISHDVKPIVMPPDMTGDDIYSCSRCNFEGRFQEIKSHCAEVHSIGKKCSECYFHAWDGLSIILHCDDTGHPKQFSGEYPMIATGDLSLILSGNGESKATNKTNGKKTIKNDEEEDMPPLVLHISDDESSPRLEVKTAEKPIPATDAASDSLSNFNTLNTGGTGVSNIWPTGSTTTASAILKHQKEHPPPSHSELHSGSASKIMTPEKPQPDVKKLNAAGVKKFICKRCPFVGLSKEIGIHCTEDHGIGWKCSYSDLSGECQYIAWNRFRKAHHVRETGHPESGFVGAFAKMKKDFDIFIPKAEGVDEKMEQIKPLNLQPTDKEPFPSTANKVPEMSKPDTIEATTPPKKTGTAVSSKAKKSASTCDTADSMFTKIPTSPGHATDNTGDSSPKASTSTGNTMNKKSPNTSRATDNTRNIFMKKFVSATGSTRDSRAKKSTRSGKATDNTRNSSTKASTSIGDKTGSNINAGVKKSTNATNSTDNTRDISTKRSASALNSSTKKSAISGSATDDTYDTTTKTLTSADHATDSARSSSVTASTNPGNTAGSSVSSDVKKSTKTSRATDNTRDISTNKYVDVTSSARHSTAKTSASAVHTTDIHTTGGSINSGANKSTSSAHAADSTYNPSPDTSVSTDHTANRINVTHPTGTTLNSQKQDSSGSINIYKCSQCPFEGRFQVMGKHCEEVHAISKSSIIHGYYDLLGTSGIDSVYMCSRCSFEGRFVAMKKHCAEVHENGKKCARCLFRAWDTISTTLHKTATEHRTAFSGKYPTIRNGDFDLLYEYDENGNIIGYETLYDIDGIELKWDDEGVPLSKQPHDAEGTPIEGFDGAGKPVYYEQEYDEDGNPIDYEYDENGNIILYDVDGIELEYDEEGMLLSEQLYDAEGIPIQGFDEEGQPVYYEEEYDEDGNLIDVSGNSEHKEDKIEESTSTGNVHLSAQEMSYLVGNNPENANLGAADTSADMIGTSNSKNILSTSMPGFGARIAKASSTDGTSTTNSTSATNKMGSSSGVTSREAIDDNYDYLAEDFNTQIGRIINIIDDAEESDPPLLSENQADQLQRLVRQGNEHLYRYYCATNLIADHDKRFRRFIKNARRMIK